jgi:hypothetical protein
MAGKNDMDDAPVYPFKVDAGAQPERKYMAATWWFARASYVLTTLSAILAILIIIRSKSALVAPYFVRWDPALQRFASFYEETYSLPQTDEQRYVEEYFAREYIMRSFTISPESADNWCACDNHGFGLFNEPKCFVCAFSSPGVYSEFAANAKPVFELWQKQGRAFSPRIISARRNWNLIDPPATGFRSWLPGGYPPRFIRSEYAIDFTSGGEYLTAYIMVMSPLSNPRYQYRVESAAFGWTPREKRGK